MSLPQRLLRALIAAAAVAGAVAVAVPVSVTVAARPASAATVPAGFQEQVVFSGLNRPTNIEFAPDGRIFVAEQRGVIKVFDNLADTTPTVFADLSTNVMSYLDRGLIAMTLAPGFPTNPWVYVGYTYDAPPGGTAPVYNDGCGALANAGNCIVTSRLSRLQAQGNTMVGSEQALVTDWCQQYTSHSIGDLRFGPDGALYLTGGEGASTNAVDYGQFGTPPNPCGDPVNEGGALRSQDVRTTTDATQLNGTVVRLDPATGAAMPGNPNFASPDPNTGRIVAYGLRNPFRTTFRPGTGELWVADVGWAAWEEINRIQNPTAGVVNLGWPCYEGAGHAYQYDNANVPLCESLYATGPAPTSPYFTWNHANPVVPGETCPTGGSAASGLAFYPTSGGTYPAQYRGALFFADYTRRCIWAMKTTASSGGLPSPASIETFMAGAASPTDIAIGPGGELYYSDLGGTVRRLRYYPGDQPPVANIAASTLSGGLPLTVSFNGTGSNDADAADAGRLTYAWDFTNDGTVDSTSPTPTFTYTTAGSFTAKLTVTDTLGATGTATVTILAGLGAPTAVIDTPSAALTWATGDVVTFSGHATDPQNGTLDPSRLTWQLRLQHCAVTLNNCHTHVIQEFTGASGSFVAPDHEYPSYVELQLTATDLDGISHSVLRRLNPKTVGMTFATSTPGLTLSVGSFTGQTPFTVEMIVGASTTISAPTPQFDSSVERVLTGWSDGGAATHVFTAPSAPGVLTASYSATPVENVALNKTATSSTECNANETAPKAVNGSVTGGYADKWCGATAAADKWLMVDLGASYDLHAFVVRHAGAGGEPVSYNTRDFAIDVSDDATTWTTAVSAAGNTANVTTHPVSLTTRYARLRVTAPTSTGLGPARIYEFEALAASGPTQDPPPPMQNFALNKTATSNTMCNPNEPAPKAFNGTTNAGNSDKWCGQTAVTDKWLMVDLGNTYNLSALVVHHAGAGGEPASYNTRDFLIETSTDATAWINAATVTGNTANVTTHVVSVAARYVRLRIITASQLSPPGAARIYELQAIGTTGSTPPPPPPPPPPTTNVALNKTATSSTACSGDETAPKAVNGSVNGGSSDKWCGDPSVADKWLMVDLGASYSLTSFVVHHAGDGGDDPVYNTRDFTIEVSNDATIWATAVMVTGNTANVTTHPVSVTARYVRLRIITASQLVPPGAARIYELEAIGEAAPPSPTLTNLALNKTATSNTMCNVNEAAPKAVNGSVSGGNSDKWCGESSVADKWLMVDLGAAYNLTSFVVHHAGDGGETPSYDTRDFTIEISTDGSAWTTAVTVTGNTANVTTHPVSVIARYVRLRIGTASQLVPAGAARIYELEAIGIQT